MLYRRAEYEAQNKNEDPHDHKQPSFPVVFPSKPGERPRHEIKKAQHEQEVKTDEDDGRYTHVAENKISKR